MTLNDQLARLRQNFAGFNAPASVATIDALQKVVGPLPDEVLTLYADHNGEKQCLTCGDVRLFTRLMPAEEAIEFNATIGSLWEQTRTPGRVAILWTDDNSNYLGVYTSGLLVGWLTVLSHEEPNMVPAFRAVEGFYDRLLASAPGLAPEDCEAVDLVTVPRELPVVVDDPQHVETDRGLAATFRELYKQENDPEQRRMFAMCSMAVTPVAETSTVLGFLQDDDTWTPEAAVSLLELRRYRGGVDELQRLAREGGPNGDSAAMRQLVRMRTNSSRQAIENLKSTLAGQKLARLEMWLSRADRLQPPRWP